MAHEIPDYLRLHTEEPIERQDPPVVDEQPGLHAFCRAFERATGWNLAIGDLADQGGPSESEAGHSQTVPPVLTPSTSKAAQGIRSADRPPFELPAVEELASAFAAVAQELSSTRHELRRREAELAAGVPVTARRDEERDLAIRLESILQGGAEAIGCQAAALYALDDATTQLKMRAAWGLPVSHLMKPARPLRGAVADLEALVGHAVVLEDTSLLPHWRVPEKFASAVCVPVSSPTEPLGTLWIFGNQVRSYTEEQTNLAEIIAGRIAAELQREVLLNECVSSKQLDHQLARAARWQGDRLPNVKPLLDDWQVAGATHASQVLGQGFYDWFVPRDGSLALVLGCGEGSMIESALTAASLQGSLRSHAEHLLEVSRVVAHVNESFWNTSAGGQFASLWYAKLQPDSGEVESCGMGCVVGHVVTSEGVQSVSSDYPPLGTEPNSEPKTMRAHLAPGDTLVVVYDSRLAQPGGEAPSHYVDALRHHCTSSADDMITAVRGALLEEASGGPEFDWAVVVAKRQG